jgi:hypothetical protein
MSRNFEIAGLFFLQYVCINDGFAGGFGWDTWLGEGYDGFETELSSLGEQFPTSWSGYVKLKTTYYTQNFPAEQGAITGRINTAQSFAPITEPPTPTPQTFHQQVCDGKNGAFVALLDLNTGNDQTNYIARVNAGECLFRARHPIPLALSPSGSNCFSASRRHVHDS